MSYYSRLDGLRFVAIIMVLLQHFGGILPRKIHVGYYGVELFFVISGFLITSLLLEKKAANFKTFYLKFITRRAFRIFPLYYIVIVILWILNLDVVRAQLLSLVTYTFNYAWVYYSINTTPINHFWTLCVEEQFYLIWPIVIYIFRNSTSKLIAFLIISISIGHLLYVTDIFPELIRYKNVSLLTKFPSLGMGSLFAIYNKNYKINSTMFESKTLEVLSFFILIYILIFSTTYRDFLLSFISLFYVAKSTIFDFKIDLINKILLNNFVIYIGKISYGIYIFHLPIEYYTSSILVDPFLKQMVEIKLVTENIINYYSWIFTFPIYTGFTILLAAFSYHFIELPILKFRNTHFV